MGAKGSKQKQRQRQQQQQQQQQQQGPKKPLPPKPRNASQSKQQQQQQQQQQRRQQQRQQQQQQQEYATPPSPQAQNVGENGLQQYRAIYDYEAQQAGDLSFQQGDIVLVQEASKQADRNWWKARLPQASSFGFVPSNFLVEYQPGDPKLLPGFFEFSRCDAEKELVRPKHQHGTYLLRPCSTQASAVVISVKYRHLEEFKINHYKVKTDVTGQQFFIVERVSFPSIEALLEYYQNEGNGLVCGLAAPADLSTKPVLPFRDLIIEENLVKVSNKIGSGSFGVVYRGKLLGKIDVAVKQLKMESGLGTEDSLVSEAQTQYQLSHKNVIQLIGYTRPQYGGFWLIMEFAEKGSLYKHLQKCRDFRQQIDFIRQVACGMKFLESERVVHRDLRCANLLLTEKDEIKIADFGLARVLAQYDSRYTVEAAVYQGSENCKFPLRWTAPEGINGFSFSVKSDVWSFGVCVYEIVSCGKKPYHGLSNEEVKEQVKQGKPLENPLEGKFERDDPRHMEARYLYEEIMLNCWRLEPEERPTFEFLSACFEDFSMSVSNRFQMYD